MKFLSNEIFSFLFFLLLPSTSIINHTLLSKIRAVISTLTCMSTVSNSTSDSECYSAVRKSTIAALIYPRCMREGYGSWFIVCLSVTTLAATYLVYEYNLWCCKVPYGVPNA